MLFFGINHAARIQNVFDEIYHDLRIGRSGLHGRNIFGVHSHPQMGRLDYWPRELGGRFADGVYNSEYLDENQTLGVSFNLDEPEIRFSLVIDFLETDERISMGYIYALDSRTLTRRPISVFESHARITDEDAILYFLERHSLTMEELAELHHWFLFDLFLADWFDGEQVQSRFSPDNLGRFTFEDARAE